MAVDSEEARHAPTARVLARAREEAAPVSPELPQGAVLLSGVGLLVFGLAGVSAGIAELFQGAFAAVRTGRDPRLMLSEGWAFSASWLVPALLVVLLVALLSNLAQTGFVFSAGRAARGLAFRAPWSEVSWQGAAWGLFKVAMVVLIAWPPLRDGLRAAFGGLSAPDQSLGVFGAALLQLALRVGAALMGLAVVDVLHRRAGHLRRLRLTGRQLREEQRQTLGDPAWRAQRRQAHREVVMSARQDPAQEVRQ